MSITPEERLDELEHDPYDHDRLDVEALLRVTGFECVSYPELQMNVWVHPVWQLTFTLDVSRRRVPIKYLLDMIAEVRRSLLRESR